MTKKYVLTGPMRSGKSDLKLALSEKLKGLGLQVCVMHEAAQYFIDLEKTSGKPESEWIVPWNKPKFLEYQTNVFTRQNEWERDIPNYVDAVVMDRARPDSKAYLAVEGYANDPLYARVSESIKRDDYSLVLMCEFIGDEMMDKNEKERRDIEKREKISDELLKAYRSHGYEPIVVKKFYNPKDILGLSDIEKALIKKKAIEKRVEFVMKHIEM